MTSVAFSSNFLFFVFIFSLIYFLNSENENAWDPNQSRTIQYFCSFTDQINRGNQINLISGWTTNTVPYSVGEDGHELITDGLFGDGVYLSQFPGSGEIQNEDEGQVLMSWVLMGKVFPLVEPLKERQLMNGFDSHYMLKKNTQICNFDDIPDSMSSFKKGRKPNEKEREYSPTHWT